MGTSNSKLLTASGLLALHALQAEGAIYTGDIQRASNSVKTHQTPHHNLQRATHYHSHSPVVKATRKASRKSRVKASRKTHKSRVKPSRHRSRSPVPKRSQAGRVKGKGNRSRSPVPKRFQADKLDTYDTYIQDIRRGVQGVGGHVQRGSTVVYTNGESEANGRSADSATDGESEGWRPAPFWGWRIAPFFTGDMMSDGKQEPSKYKGPQKYPRRANKKQFMKKVKKKARDMMNGGNSPFPYDSDAPQQPWGQQPGAPAQDMMNGGNSPFPYDSDTPKQPKGPTKRKGLRGGKRRNRSKENKSKRK